MEADISQYIGEWVAICEGRVIVHGKNIKTVAEAAKISAKGKKFLLAKVPDKETMIF